MYGIDQRTNTAPPCLLCSSCFTPGDVVYLVHMLARLPGLCECVCCLLPPLAKITHGEASNVDMVRACVVSLLYFTSSSRQSTVNLTCQRSTNTEEEERSKVMPLGVHTVRSDQKGGRVQLSLCCRAARWNRLLFQHLL